MNLCDQIYLCNEKNFKNATAARTIVNLSDLNITIDEMKILCEEMLISDNNKQTFLYLFNANIDCKSLIILSNFIAKDKYVVHLDLSFNTFKSLDAISEFVNALSLNKTLEHLRLNFCNFSPEAFIMLTKILCVNNNLKLLDFTWNKMDKNTANNLGKSLCINKSLEILILRWNEIDDGIITLILSNCYLEKDSNNDLELESMYKHELYCRKKLAPKKCSCHINAQFCQCYCEDSFLWNKIRFERNMLTHLDISNNSITWIGVSLIVKSMEKKRFLFVHLLLNSNSINIKGAMQLADSLKDNQFLKYLEIADNEINNQGAIAFGVALTCNKTLEHLNISKNYISSEGAKSIANGLSNNYSLKHLDMSENNICQSGMIDILISLRKNIILENINLCLNKCCFGFFKKNYNTSDYYAYSHDYNENDEYGNLQNTTTYCNIVQDKLLNIFEKNKTLNVLEIDGYHVPWIIWQNFTQTFNLECRQKIYNKVSIKFERKKHAMLINLFNEKESVNFKDSHNLECFHFHNVILENLKHLLRQQKLCSKSVIIS